MIRREDSLFDVAFVDFDVGTSPACINVYSESD